MRSSLTSPLVPLIEPQTKRDLYIKIFKQEFIRELAFIWDAVNDRGCDTKRSTFTMQLAAKMKDAANVLPLGGKALEIFASAIEFAANEVRDKEMGGLANIYETLDIKRLEILVDVVAREAYRRYEFFIENRLCDQPEDGVIPFAKVGVARCLEHLARKKAAISPADWKREKLASVGSNSNKQEVKKDEKPVHVELSESFLLNGLVEGRSGAFVQGWSNNKVKLKDRKKKVDAEDAYARSAFIHFNVERSQLNQALYTREKARHKEKTLWETLQSIYKGETESLFDFGRVKYDEAKDPLCGYAVMPLKVIKDRYDYQKHDEKTLSYKFKSELLERQNLSVVQIDKETLKQYVTWYRQNTQQVNNRVADYLRKKTIWRGAQWVICQDDLSDVDLEGVNLSNMDLSGVKFPSKLSETNFTNSYLISAEFTKGTNVKSANFAHAQCVFLKAEEVDFSDANLTQANFSYAKLAKAKLEGVKLLGAIWHEADLSNIIGDVEALKQQKLQLQTLENELKNQHAEMKKFSEQLVEQTANLNQLREQIDIKIQQAVLANKDSESMVQLQALNDEIQQLIKQQEARAVFEYSCENDIKQLNQSMKQVATKDDLEALKQQLQQTQDQLKIIQENNAQAAQQIPQELEKQLNTLSSQHDALKQELKDSIGRIQQELQNLIKKQTEQFKTLETKFKNLNEQLSERTSKLERRVDTIEVKMDRLDANRPENTVINKILKLRQSVLEKAPKELDYYVEPNGQAKPGMGDPSPLYPWVEKEFLQSESQVLLLQGEAGAGKSTFNRHLIRELWNRSEWQEIKIHPEKLPNAWIPIFIPLGACENPRRLTDYLLQLPETPECRFTQEELNVLTKTYSLLLIADGYDEMPEVKPINLYDANQLWQYKGRVKLLIGCRTQRVQKLNESTWFAPHDQQQVIAPDNLYKVRCVAPFNDQQIESYLKKYLTKNQDNKEIWPDAATYLKYLQQIPELRTLITTPFLLLILVEVLPRIIKEVAAQNKDKNDENAAVKALELTRSKLYDRFLQGWFERQEKKLRIAGKLPAQGDIKQDFQEFCLALAKNFQKANITAVQYPVKPLRLFEKPVAVGWVEELFSDKDAKVVLAREGSPLRVSAGNWHQFIHASLIDYITATNSINSLNETFEIAAPTVIHDVKNDEKDSLKPTVKLTNTTLVETKTDDSTTVFAATKFALGKEYMLSRNILSRDQVSFYADGVKEKPSFAAFLWSVLECSKQDPEVTIAAANAITILNAAEVNFSGKDLNHIRIPGADLSGALCDSVNFKNADLRNVNFQGAWLRGSNFTNAQMQGVKFGVLPKINYQFDSQNHPGYFNTLSRTHDQLANVLVKFIAESNRVHIIDLVNRKFHCYDSYTSKELIAPIVLGEQNFIDSEEKFVYSFSYDKLTREYKLLIINVASAENYTYKFSHHSELEAKIHFVASIEGYIPSLDYTRRNNKQIILIAEPSLGRLVLLIPFNTSLKTHVLNLNFNQLKQSDSKSETYELSNRYDGYSSSYMNQNLLVIQTFDKDQNRIACYFNFKSKKIFNILQPTPPPAENTDEYKNGGIYSSVFDYWAAPESALFFVSAKYSISDTATRAHTKQIIYVIDVEKENVLYEFVPSYEFKPHGWRFHFDKEVPASILSQARLFKISSMTTSTPAVVNSRSVLSLAQCYGFNSQDTNWVEKKIDLTRSTIKCGKDVDLLVNPTHSSPFLVMLRKNGNITQVLCPFEKTKLPIEVAQNITEVFWSQSASAKGIVALYTSPRTRLWPEAVVSKPGSTEEQASIPSALSFEQKAKSGLEKIVERYIGSPVYGRNSNSLIKKHPTKLLAAVVSEKQKCIFIVSIDTEEQLQVIKWDRQTPMLFEWDKTGEYLLVNEQSFNISGLGTIRNWSNEAKFEQARFCHDKIVAQSLAGNNVLFFDPLTGKHSIREGKQDDSLKKDLCLISKSPDGKYTIRYDAGCRLTVYVTENQNIRKLGEFGDSINRSYWNQSQLPLPQVTPVKWHTNSRFFLYQGSLFECRDNEVVLLYTISRNKTCLDLDWHRGAIVSVSENRLFKTQLGFEDKGANAVNLAEPYYLQAEMDNSVIKLACFDTDLLQLKAKISFSFPFKVSEYRIFNYSNNKWDLVLNFSHALICFEIVLNAKHELTSILRWSKGFLGFFLDQIVFSQETQLDDLTKKLFMQTQKANAPDSSNTGLVSTLPKVSETDFKDSKVPTDNSAARNVNALFTSTSNLSAQALTNNTSTNSLFLK